MGRGHFDAATGHDKPEWLEHKLHAEVSHHERVRRCEPLLGKAVVLSVRQCLGIAQWFTELSFQRRVFELETLAKLHAVAASIVPGTFAWLCRLVLFLCPSQPLFHT